MTSTKPPKTTRFKTVLILLAVACAAAPGPVMAGESPALAIVRQARPQPQVIEATGFVPPAGDLSHIKPRPLRTLAPLPPRFDWREHGKVTPVRDQSTCGSCYAFAVIANVESRMLIDGEPGYDFSENNIKECEWYESSCGGGNYHRMANFLSQKGTVLESCDPYVPANVACKSTCRYVTTLLGWSLVAAESIPEPDLLKSYIMAYGPLYTSLYAGSGESWYAEMKSYDGSYTLYNPTTEEPNHAVLLIGWDDSLHHDGGQGAWIAKNSWGRMWGGTCGYGSQRGFFTMAYGSAMMGCWSSTITEWQDHDPDGRLLYHDEGGYMAEAHAGFEGVTAWGMCEFIADEDVRIERIEFWATDATTDIDVYIYDDFDGTSLSTLLTSEIDRSFPEYGYHSVELSSPVAIRPGDDSYAVVKFTNSSFTYPVALDANGPVAPGMCYVSADGSDWQDVRTIEACENCDVCIRLRGTELAGSHIWRVPDDVPTISEAVGLADAGDTVLVAPGIYREGSILVDETIVVMSEAGPESTVIDASSTTAFGSHEYVVGTNAVGSGALLRGFTLTGLENPYATGVIAITNSTPTIENCVIARNEVALGAGIRLFGSSPQIVGCTIEANTAAAGVYVESGCGGELRNTIISNTSGGKAVTCLEGASLVISCCNLYWNAQGDAVCGIDGGGNFSEDPLFCAASGDYSLQDASPCLTGGGCGRVGAIGQGCPTEVPAGLVSFSVTPGDTSNELTWTLPAPPVQGALIVYSTSDYPDSAGAGAPVENGNAGYFMGSPSADGKFVHTGLANDTTYYYTAYAYNGELTSGEGLTASGTPEDAVAPSAPSGFTAQPAPGEVTLAWTYPADWDAEGIVIRYSTFSYPASTSEGSPVENGVSGIFIGTPGTDSSFTHDGLTDDIVYYYSAFGFDEVPNYSSPAQARGSPGDVTPPGEVTGFTVETRDESLRLHWTNPTDTDFEGTLIRYSTTAFPIDPADGAPVENGSSGVFAGAPASQDSFAHQGLTNDQVYYYTAFAFDGRTNYSGGEIGIGTPADNVAPGSISGFTVTAGDAAVVLRWTNPHDADFEHTLIRYSTASYPTSPGDGTGVENGSGGVFANLPARVDSFAHTGLTNNTTYYYTAFAADEVPNYSSATYGVATPEDNDPPGAVVSFTAVPGDCAARLRWTNPDDEDFVGSLIRYSTVTYPTGPDDGIAVENGHAGRFDCAKAVADSFVHTGLVNETTYYYSILAYDEMPNYSLRDTVSVTPYDQTPPEFSIAVFQNPYITNHLDIFVTASEAIADTSLRCTVGNTYVELEITDPSHNVCRGDYDLSSSGLLSIRLAGRDLRGNWASTGRDFSSSLILAASGGRAVSPDGRFEVRLLPGILRRDAYVLVLEAATPGEHRGQVGGTVYEVSPGGLRTDDYIEVSIAYDAEVREPSHLCMARVNSTGAEPIPSYLNRGARRVIAHTQALGSYVLVWRPDEITPDYASGGLTLLQNVPNPFAGSTRITFELTRHGRAGVDVISVDGRVVRRLLDRVMPPGRHTVEWDGQDSAGKRVASGLYFYRLRATSQAVTRKMVFLD